MRGGIESAKLAKEMEWEKCLMGIKNNSDKSEYTFDDRFLSKNCICKLCGEHIDVVLHQHAQLHGFKDAYEFLAKDCVLYDKGDNKK